MAGKRVYITIPEEDFELLGRWAMMGSECRGQLCRRIVLAALYAMLRSTTDLQEYETAIQERRRQRMLDHGR